VSEFSALTLSLSEYLLTAIYSKHVWRDLPSQLQEQYTSVQTVDARAAE